jgi:hypothetical protein
MAAQDLGGHGVEGAEPAQALPLGTDQGERALAHLARGLVGEGDHQHLRRPGLALGEDVRDARGEHARLARARAGEDEQRAFGVEHGLALFGVEAFEPFGVDAAIGRTPMLRRAGGGALRNGAIVSEIGVAKTGRNVLAGILAQVFLAFRRETIERDLVGERRVVVRTRLARMRLRRVFGRELVVREGNV